MADESMELEDGEVVASVVKGPSSAADDVRLRAQLDEATQVLSDRGETNLVRLARALVELDLRDATWVLDDEVRDDDDDFSGDPALFDAFRHSIRWHVFYLQEAGYEEHDISAVFAHLVLGVAQLAAAGNLRLDDDDDIDTTQPYRRSGGGFGAVRASAAAVRSLVKQQTFRTEAGGNESVAEGGCGGGITECSICFEEFVDGGQVTVMPCPSRGHRFHPDCIVKWLRISNTCPLCRHVLPVY